MSTNAAGPSAVAEDCFPSYDVYRRSNLNKRSLHVSDDESGVSRSRFLTDSRKKQKVKGGLRPLKLQVNPPQLFDKHSQISNVPQPPLQSRTTRFPDTRAIIEGDQAGWGTVSYVVHDYFPIVFEKRVAVSDSVSRDVIPTSHPNLVNLLGTRRSDSGLVLIYENMALSLADILASPSPALEAYETAALCTEVIKGLLYVERELGIQQIVNCDTVLFTPCGQVKIANVGESMLAAPATKSTTSLAQLVTAVWNGRHHVPQSSETSALQDFVRDAAGLSCSELLSHDFLQASPGTGCLMPHVCIAMTTMRKRWKVPASQATDGTTRPPQR